MNKASFYDYFSLNELKCKCGQCKSTGQEMDLLFMGIIGDIRRDINIPLIVSSAYRCPDHNDKVSGTGRNGPHTTGLAIDFLIYGKTAYKLVDLAMTYQISGIGINQKGEKEKRFIHLDNLSNSSRVGRPYIWSY